MTIICNTLPADSVTITEVCKEKRVTTFKCTMLAGHYLTFRQNVPAEILEQIKIVPEKYYFNLSTTFQDAADYLNKSDCSDKESCTKQHITYVCARLDCIALHDYRSSVWFSDDIYVLPFAGGITVRTNESGDEGGTSRFVSWYNHRFPESTALRS